MSAAREYGFLELNPGNTPKDMSEELFRAGSVYYAETSGNRIVSLLALLKSGMNPEEMILYGIYTAPVSQSDEIVNGVLEKRGLHPLKLIFNKAYEELTKDGYKYLRARLIGNYGQLTPYYMILRKEYFIPVSLNKYVCREEKKDVILQEWIRDLSFRKSI